MAMGPLGARSSVEPNITSRKNSVSKASPTEARQQGVPTRASGHRIHSRQIPPAKLNPSLPLATTDNKLHSDDCSQNLRYNIGQEFGNWKALSDHKPNRYCGIDMASRNRPDGKGHGEQGQPKRQCDTCKADTQVRKCSREHRRFRNRRRPALETVWLRAERVCGMISRAWRGSR